MNFYEILKTKKLGRGSPDYWTQLFAEHVGGKGEWKVAGVLPLTFTAKAGATDTWTIYGNDEPNVNVFIAEGSHLGYLSKSGEVLANPNNLRYTDYIELPEGISLTIEFDGFDAQKMNSPACCFYDSNKVFISGESFYNVNPKTFIIPANAVYFCTSYRVVYTNRRAYTLIGVGERTKNKMPVPVNGVYSANRTTVTVTDGVYHIVQTEGSGLSSVYIDLPEFEVPDSGYINYLNSMAFTNAAVVLRYNGASLSGGYALTPINRVVDIGSDYAGKKVNQIQIYTTGNVAMDFTIAPMITDSNTYTAYIPYGYQIPLTVSQQGHTDKSYTFYIGDTPLTEGQQVSKTSIGQDIELFKGENVVSTMLYNKPTMEIKYK